MGKFIAPLFTVLCLCVFATPAQALPISACNVVGQDPDGNDLLTCDMYNSDAGGNPSEESSAANPFQSPDWYESWVIIYEDALHTIATDVLHFAVGAAGGANDVLYLFSDGSPNFAAMLAAALAGTHMGVTRNASGTSTTNPTTFYVNFQASLQNTAGDPFSCVGNPPGTTCDTINVFSDGSQQQPVIPEPATLTLVSLGAIGEALRRRRNRSRV